MFPVCRHRVPEESLRIVALFRSPVARFAALAHGMYRIEPYEVVKVPDPPCTWQNKKPDALTEGCSRIALRPVLSDKLRTVLMNIRCRMHPAWDRYWVVKVGTVISSVL